MGGLGLHSSTNKVGSLRSRITWKFIQNPLSIFNRIIILKYGSNVWNSNVKRGACPTWKILLDGAYYLNNIIRWKVENGNKVNILNDVGILDMSLNKWPTFAKCLVLQNASV